MIQQLSIFDLPVQDTPTKLRYPNPKKAKKFRDLADRMQSQIDNKLNPAIGQQRPTRRRARIAASMREDGEKLALIQAWLYAMADALDEGTLPRILSDISTKTQLSDLADFRDPKWRDDSIKRGLAVDGWARSLLRANLGTVSSVRKAILALEELHQAPVIDPKVKQIAEIERSLIGAKIPGYFPTPKPICEQMVKLAILQPGMRVWEPSGGKGDIASAIKEAADVNLEVCELNYNLRELLKLKGFNVIASDCFDITTSYDRILMNPPFVKGSEINHIRYAFDRLVDGGRLVAIVPESIEFRKDKKYREFREWLEDKCIINDPLPQGSFLNSDRSTGVNTRILVLER
ncbi:MAG: methyltransferase [Crocosphaera sp.]|uniref:methyltransferase n=1 Tax=Crocosphaera sp. TaxID=2729996 RepID=UPI00258A73CC|nr:methyltransferase [Crocosphaera sp.]MCH2246346.1 methyltransferase [Crocosphaera sp.]